MHRHLGDSFRTSPHPLDNRPGKHPRVIRAGFKSPEAWEISKTLPHMGSFDVILKDFLQDCADEANPTESAESGMDQ